MRAVTSQTDWPTYNGANGGNRYSTLTQINKDTAKSLVPVWNYSFADDRSEESQPLVYQGVIYVTTHNATMARSTRCRKNAAFTIVRGSKLVGVVSVTLVYLPVEALYARP